MLVHTHCVTSGACESYKTGTLAEVVGLLQDEDGAWITYENY